MIKRYLIKKIIRIYKRSTAELQFPIVKYLTRKWIVVKQFIGVNEYVQFNKNKIDFIEKKEVDLYYSPIRFYGENTLPTLIKANTSLQYTAIIEDVQIKSSSNIIIVDDNFVLYDLMDQFKESNINFTDEGMVIAGDGRCIIVEETKNIAINEGILMTGNYDANFYHFVYEILVKFSILKSLKINKKVPLLFSNVVLKVKQYVDLIEMLNEEKRKIIALDYLQVYPIKKLYHISSINFIPPNYIDILQIDNNQNQFDLTALHSLRNDLLKNAKPIAFAKRIFISRKNASERRSYNEAKVYECLVKFGFEIFYPEEFSIAEQLHIFNMAEFIVGATGAAFTNILFCNANCNIICLTNFPIKVSIFSTLAASVPVSLEYLYDKRCLLNEESYLHANFEIDTEILETLIDKKINNNA
jgi:capsular polysaccharide biosynthesis protein